MQRNRLLRNFKLDPETEKPFIDFCESVSVARSEGEDENDKTYHMPFTCDGPFKVSDELSDTMIKLRKHGLELLGIHLEDFSKQIKKWRCVGVKIAGDHDLKQSRAVLTMAVISERTGKWSKIKTGQVTMYPEADDKSKYFDVDKLTPIIETLIDKVWGYLGGEYGEEDVDIEENPQLILFPEIQETSKA